MKQWYRLTDKPEVEYSTDFQFFIRHQLFVAKSGNRYSFCSFLESKCFALKRAVFGNYELSDDQKMEIAKQIHKEIIEGKHGQGELVN